MREVHRATVGRARRSARVVRRHGADDPSAAFEARVEAITGGGAALLRPAAHFVAAHLTGTGLTAARRAALSGPTIRAAKPRGSGYADRAARVAESSGGTRSSGRSTRTARSVAAAARNEGAHEGDSREPCRRRLGAHVSASVPRLRRPPRPGPGRPTAPHIRQGVQRPRPLETRRLEPSEPNDE